MNRKMQKYSVIRTLGLLVAAGALIGFTTPEVQAQEKSVVVHLGSFNEDWQATVMALGVATNLRRAGADVTVYLDRNAVRMAETRQPLGTIIDRDLGSMVDEFVGMGGRFLVCGHCARIAGVDETQLRRGFTIGGPEDIAGMFMEADISIGF